MSTNKGNATRVIVDLIFTGVYREDTGVYKCTASNLLNEVTKLIPLIIQCMLITMYISLCIDRRM